MSRIHIVLLVGVVVVCLIFFGAVGLGFSHSSDSTTHQGWTDALGNLMVSPAQPSDLSPSAPGCLQGNVVTAAVGQACTYGLKAGFLAHKVRLKVTSAPLAVQVTMHQPNILTESKTLTTGQEASFNYQRDGSTLTVQCAGLSGHCVLTLE